MKFSINYQDSYSRGELLLRTFFGIFYIGIPHFFILGVLNIGVAISIFIAFWAILFTGKFPKGMFVFIEKYMRWYYRASARLLNLADGYPKFGLEAEDDAVDIQIDYPESLSRGKLLLKAFFGVIYVIIPHVFVLFFRMIVAEIFIFVAWFAVLFTGNYPRNMHTFIVDTFRWAFRVNLYMMFMTDVYPPFNGKAEDEELVELESTN